MLVRESISQFVRGEDPRKSLEIGDYAKIPPTVDLNLLPDGFYELYRTLKTGFKQKFLGLKENGFFIISYGIHSSNDFSASIISPRVFLNLESPEKITKFLIDEDQIEYILVLDLDLYEKEELENLKENLKKNPRDPNFKHRIIESVSNFVRGGDPKKTLGLGGYTLDTLRVGSILISTKFEGITSTGNFTSPFNGSHKKRKDAYYLVLDIKQSDQLFDLKILRVGFDFKIAQELQKTFLSLGRNELRNNFFDLTKSYWSYCYARVKYLTPKKFDNRFKVIDIAL